MEMNYFLGLDGGGTRTTAELADEYGNIVCRVVGDSINYYSEGLYNARANFKNILDEITEKNGGIRPGSIFIGLSALFGKASEEELYKFTEGITTGELVGMDSDLYIALEAMMQPGECAVVIAGTGSMAVARQSGGSVICRGGYGYILGDEGSGYKIALEGIQRAIMAYEGAAAATAITDALLKKFNVGDMHELIDLFYDPPIERKVIADFAQQVFECAEAGDAIALDVIKEESRKLADTTDSLLREFESDIPLGVFGGLFQYRKIYLDAFTCALRAKRPSQEIKPLPITPVRGAILAAMEQAGRQITEKIKNNLLKVSEAGS